MRVNEVTLVAPCATLRPMAEEPRGDTEDHLLTAAIGLRLVDIQTTIDGPRVYVSFRIDPEVLSSAVWALTFSFGAMSFQGAPSPNLSSRAPSDGDRWSIGDMLSHLLFENGRLYFLATCIRGREMNTRIEIDQDGEVLIETIGRSHEPLAWIAALQESRIQ